MPKSIAFGTFDGFHAGHKHYLDAAASLGDLTVIVARDTTVKKVKGRPPILGEDARLAGVLAAGYDARFGSEGDKYAVLEELKPDIICLGYDQVAFTNGLEEACSRLGLSAKIVRIGAYKPEIYKSSLLNKRDATPDRDVESGESR